MMLPTVPAKNLIINWCSESKPLIDLLESSIHLRTQFADVGFDAIEAPTHFSEAPIDRPFESVEPLVDLVEAPFNLLEAAVHLFEAAVDLLEAGVDPARELLEAEIDSFRELVDAFFGARLGHGLHG
jgi:hypothetical protein